MKAIPFEQYNKYASVFILLTILFLSYLILKPFITAILWSILLAYMFSPLYKWLNKRIKSPNVSASLVLIIFFIMGGIVMFFLLNTLVSEAVEIKNFIKVSESYFNLVNINFLPSLISKATDYLINTTSNFVISIPGRVLNIMVSLFVMFYLLTQGEEFLKNLKDRIPLEDKQKDYLIGKFAETVHALIFGLLVTGIIQAIVIGIAFYIFNVGSPILFAIIVLIFAILPAVGVPLIWIPAVIIKFLAGNYTDALGILLVGILIITPIEAILKPHLIGKKSSLHPLAILIGVIGGVGLMGFVGMVYGPLILLIAINLIKFIEETKNIKLTV